MDFAKLKQQADAGGIVAQSVLGICYLYGYEDVPLDYAEAFRLLSIAGKRGAPRAQANLARMYAEGLGIPKDPQKAVYYYELAAERGEFFAQIELARMYARGDGIPVSRESAVKWYSAILHNRDKFEDCEDEMKEAEEFISGRRA